MKLFFTNSDESSNNTLISLSDVNVNEWYSLEAYIDFGISPATLFIEATVQFNDEGKIMNGVIIAVDDFSFSPNCK